MQRLDEACDRFEAAWRRGDRPALGGYLLGLEGAARARLFRELLELELDLRGHEHEHRGPGPYLELFPEHAEIVDDVFARRDGTAADARQEETADFTAGQDLVPGNRPRIIAGYEVLCELGRGGMGVVYKARQAALGRMVALKLIRSAEFATPAELARFQNEAEAVARLDHPHIVPIYEVGQHRGIRFFSMKLVEGSSLDRKLEEYAGDFADAARLLALAAEAVHHAHVRGILHRDLKPANILVDAQGDPHVTDFGLARRMDSGADLTQSGLPMGTPSYMSPEQARGEKDSLTTATDVYGLGSILFALLTGRAPFAGSSLAETLDQVRDVPAPPPSRLNRRVPRDLEVICLKCLEKEPDRRYPGADALAQDLRRWLGGEPIHSRPVGIATRSAMWCRRHPLPAALAGLLALSVLGGLAGIGWKWREAVLARDEAVLARDEAEAINDFLLHGLLDQASPRYNPRGADLTVGELLDRTAATMGRVFEGRPAVEASIRRTLGSTYQALGLHEQAEPQFREAIRLGARVRGEGDQETLGDVNRLAALLDQAGRHQEAEPLMRRNLEDCTRSLGPTDRTTLEAEYQLAVLLGHLRRHDEAEGLLRHCIEGQRRSLGPQDAETLRSINQLAGLLLGRGKLEEAYSLADEYERGVRCLWGTKHPDNVTAKESLARVRLAQDQLDVAELLYQAAADEAERIFGPEHPRTFSVRSEYASVLQKNGKRDEASRLLQGVWEMSLSRRGSDDPETLKAGCRLARFLVDTGKAGEAGQVLRTVLPRSETRLGPDHPTTREAAELLSRVDPARAQRR
jgi:tetratricopeptide (TPR) repeat protein/tRNA A-37 threonylcarbamoyl transferase component Bud32